MIDKLYTEYHKPLLWYCINLSNNNASMAEDIVQETFIRAMENVHTLNELSDGQCRSWLYRTAKNIFIDRVRRVANEPNPEMPLIGEDDLSIVIVKQLCTQLPEEEGRLFWMRYIEGYRSTELGEIFDLPPSTVRSKLSSARKKMTKIYFQQKSRGDQ